MDAPVKPRIYLDNAATSWPKPPEVAKAMAECVRTLGAPAGRGAYESALESDIIVHRCRRRVARLLGGSSDNVVFTSSGTHALNIALLGFLRSGDHVVTTQIEHNSIVRPLSFLQRDRSVRVTEVACDSLGFVDPVDVKAAIEPSTKLIAISTASNVTGAIQDLDAIAGIARESGIVVLLDAAQTLGHLAINIREWPVCMLASSGHKGCMGPLGTGFLYIAPEIEGSVEPLMFGGTGLSSSHTEMPLQMPARHEPGNLNVPAIAGLDRAIQWLEATCNEDECVSMVLADQLATQLTALPGVRVLRSARSFAPVVSIVVEGYQSTDIAAILDGQFGIEVRAGLHCSPRIHEAAGTQGFGGTVRFSLGDFSTESDVGAAVDAVSQIAGVTTNY